MYVLFCIYSTNATWSFLRAETLILPYQSKRLFVYSHKLVRFGVFLSMQAFRDTVSYLAAFIFNMLSPSSLEEVKGDCGDRMPEPKYLNPEVTHSTLVHVLLNRATHTALARCKGVWKKSPCQAVTSQCQLCFMQGGTNLCLSHHY